MAQLTVKAFNKLTKEIFSNPNRSIKQEHWMGMEFLECMCNECGKDNFIAWLTDTKVERTIITSEEGAKYIESLIKTI